MIAVDIQKLKLKGLFTFMYAAYGSVFPLWTVYFAHMQIESDKIGMILSLYPLLCLLGGPLISNFADRTRAHKKVFLASFVLQLIIQSSFVLIPMRNFYLCAVLFALYSFFQAPTFPLIDNYVMDCLREDPRSYGQQRLWGAISWGVASLVSGVLIDAFDFVIIIFIQSLVWSLLMIAMVFCCQWEEKSYAAVEMVHVQHDDDDMESATASVDITAEKVEIEKTEKVEEPEKSLLRRIPWNTYIFSAAIAVVSINNSLQNFEFMYLSEYLDASRTLLGIAVIFAVVMELPFFFYSKWVLQKFGMIGCVVISHTTFMLRTGSYSLLTNPKYVWLSLLIEVNHGITYALIWTAGVTFFREIAPKGREASYQGFLNAIYNVGSGIGSLAMGYCYQLYGPVTMFRGICALTLVALVLYSIAHGLEALFIKSRGFTKNFDAGEDIDRKKLLGSDLSQCSVEISTSEAA